MVTTQSCAKYSSAPHKLNDFSGITLCDELNKLHNAKLNKYCIMHHIER